MVRHGWRVRYLAIIVTVVALVGAAGTSASGAAASGPPEGVSMEGTGPQPPGLGLFSKAALAQENCADNGRTTSTYEGGGPWCVNPWPDGKKNGGATSQGVTATDVSVIAYLPNEAMLGSAGGGTDLATGQSVAIEKVYADQAKAFETLEAQQGTYQLWGRKIVLTNLIASGADEASQRADALRAIAEKPFMVVDMTSTQTGGAPIFSSVVAAAKIVTVSASTDATTSTAQTPYRWNYGADPSSGPPITAALIGKALTGKKAQWAGDSGLKSKTRAFGAIYPTTGFDFAAFEKYLAENDGKLTDKVAYDPTTATAGSAQIATLVSHLKSAGVTTVVLFATPPVITNIMAAATDQQYSPEWLYTGFGYQEYDPFARANDQEQMAHAFGLAILGPAVTGSPTGLGTFAWYWGTKQGNNNATANGLFEFAYNAVHYAGPTLTPENMRKGLFAAPARSLAGSGLSGYGKTVGLPYDEYALFGGSRSLNWWDPDTTGPSQATLTVGKGLFQYLNNGDSLALQRHHVDLAEVLRCEGVGVRTQRRRLLPGWCGSDDRAVLGMSLERSRGGELLTDIDAALERWTPNWRNDHMSRTAIISVDGHVKASRAGFRDYVEQQYLEVFDEWVGAAEAAGMPDAGNLNPAFGLDSQWDSDKRLRELESVGVVAEVLFPNGQPFQANRLEDFARVQSAELADAGRQTYNRWLADFCAQAPGRRAGQALISFDDIDQAVADVHWAKEHGLGGIMMPPLNPGGIFFFDPALDPVWAAAVEVGLPISQHGGSGAPAYSPPGFASIITLAMEHSFFSGRSLWQLMAGGVFDRFPDLQVVFVETEAYWIGPMIKRLEQFTGLGSDWMGFARTMSRDATMSRSPKEYWASNCHAGLSPFSASMVPIDDLARSDDGPESEFFTGPDFFVTADKAMFGVDYPHFESILPSCAASLGALVTNPAITEEAARKVLFDNAAKIYGFDPAFLQSHVERVGFEPAALLAATAN